MDHAYKQADLDRARLAEVSARVAELEGTLNMQKLDAVGRLAGGVAHDFNNLLTVVKGCAEFLLEEHAQNEQSAADIEEILAATTRATAVTRQLLAFGRRQVLQPVVLDLNSVILGLEPLLRRVLGNDVALVARLGAIDTVRADPVQVEQVLMDLVANARDAVPVGGRLLIGTANAGLDESDNHVRSGLLAAGNYVLLTVADNGHGIPAALREKVFEPFFTTKEAGRGTGLGLAAVYGMARQSGGHVWLESEEDWGTVFTVALPSSGRPSGTPPSSIVIAPESGATATILLAEEQEAVRNLTRRILEKRGYAVIEAVSGAEALKLARSNAQRIDLLLADVMVPGMSAMEMLQSLRAICPRARVLYMSGYADEDVLRGGVLQSGARFLQKPFTGSALLTAVREALR